MRPLINPARLVPSLLSGGGICILEVGITPLVNGQAYIDVVFATAQDDTTWDTQCSVVNTTDATPLNIWPGIITAKTTTGFRLQLNGAPDTGNYSLHWSITPGPPMASGYSLSGPSSGAISVASTNFTVTLVGGGVASPVTVTPSAGGGGGTFTPASVTLTTAASSATFTYTPASYGAKTISATNDGGLTNPGSLIYTSVVTAYTLTGPSSGEVSVASTNFTVALPAGGAVIGTVTVTPSSGGGGGTFTPPTVALTTAAPSGTFTYTPATTGAKTISVTNNGGLTNPGNITYTSNPPAFSIWHDSSVNVNHATQSVPAKCPVIVANVINSLPVVRFTSAGLSGMDLTAAISGAPDWTIFAVAKVASSSVDLTGLAGGSGTGLPRAAWLEHTTGSLATVFGGNAYKVTATIASFHVFTMSTVSGLAVDGTTGGGFWFGGTGADANFDAIGRSAANYSDGDIAELIIYNIALSGTDRANIEKYLGTKYAITVAGGTSALPNTVANLKGWWKADAP